MHLSAYAPYPLLIRALRTYAPLPSPIGALHAFAFSCVVLLQLKGKLCFVCAL